MADTDQSLYNIRYNQVTQGMEGFGGGSPMWTPLILSADSVSSFNGLIGAVTLAAGTNISLTPVGNTITVASTGGSNTPNIQQNVNTSFTQTTSTSFVITNHAVTITPSKTSSQIKLSLTTNVLTPTSGSAALVTIFRGATNLAGGTSAFILGESGNPDGSSCACIYIDSPASVSAQTYTVYLASSNGDTVYCTNPSGVATAVLIAEEIFS